MECHGIRSIIILPWNIIFSCIPVCCRLLTFFVFLCNFFNLHLDLNIYIYFKEMTPSGDLFVNIKYLLLIKISILIIFKRNKFKFRLVQLGAKPDVYWLHDQIVEGLAKMAQFFYSLQYLEFKIRHFPWPKNNNVK